ncbi:MAG TPA: hypothetical protein VGN20_17665 [Mucilaginibacter sp.]|jgi:hypothetical protein
MKFFFLVALMFVSITASKQQQPQNAFKITTFTEVPREMEGCGENLFLNKQDEKAERFVFYTDYVRGLICINNKMISITRNDKSHDKGQGEFSNKDYTLVIKYVQKKTTGDENYEIKSAIITLKYHSTVVWTKSVIGGGGC